MKDISKYKGWLRSVLTGICPSFAKFTKAHHMDGTICDTHKSIAAELKDEGYVYKRYNRGRARCKECGYYETHDKELVRRLLNSRRIRIGGKV